VAGGANGEPDWGCFGLAGVRVILTRPLEYDEARLP
jgi:hypothetical protein